MSIPNDDVSRLFDHTRVDPMLSKMRWNNRGDHGSRYFLVAAPPKSGSTWVTNVLGRVLDAPRVRYCYAHSSNEHDIYVPSLLSFQGHTTIAQMHMKATPHNVQLMLDFGIMTVVLTRNVFDSMASFARDVELKVKNAPPGRRSPGTIGYSFVWLESCDLEWEAEQWIDYAIDYYLPWYMTYLQSWATYSGRVSGCRVRYERLFADPEPVFNQMLASLGVSETAPPELLERNYVKSDRISGTQSSAGAGLDRMSESQRTRIERVFNGARDPWITSHLEIDV